MKRIHQLLTLTAAFGIALGFAGTADAGHAWSNYHWARTANPFTIQMGDNLTSVWDPFLAASSVDWAKTSGSCNNASNPVRTTIVAGSAGNVKRCTAKSGTIQVCNASYGGNGWLGLASRWIVACALGAGSARSSCRGGC